MVADRFNIRCFCRLAYDTRYGVSWLLVSHFFAAIIGDDVGSCSARGTVPGGLLWSGSGDRNLRRSETSVGLVLAAVILAAGVGWSQTEYLVPPADTDPEIDSWLSEHVVQIDRAVIPRDVLLVHLPGSYDAPTSSKLLLQHTARKGVPAIGLRYPNSVIVTAPCMFSSDPACFEKARLEILDGIDRTDIVDVSEANSITNRLVKLLEYLDREHPNDEWERFLKKDGSVLWSKIIVSGHSQGAGHAAMVAHAHRVYRVGMFAGPPDYSSYFDAPAEWLSQPGATRIDHHYGFGHIRDPLVSEENLVEIWEALGLGRFGQPVSVDEFGPPFSGSHMLFTDAEPASLGLIANHNSVVLDRQTPEAADGSPRFAEVWEFMCFPDGMPYYRDLQIRRPGRRVSPQ